MINNRTGRLGKWREDSMRWLNHIGRRLRITAVFFIGWSKGLEYWKVGSAGLAKEI